ncbi:MAG TPA: glutathione S-transferase N-terminal domain-containing protein [Burkholderiales bacterium]|nr:glutathione S-transferase N-terminal domain-containing protein [Burkholderiales bacterium]
MKVTLYYAPMTCALVPYVTLTEAGADFEVENINTRNGENRSPEFLRLNPKHKVPVLLIDGEPLTENVAIQLWIARHFPNARLLPAADGDEIKAISLLAWCASGIHPHLTPNARPQNYCDLPGSEESVKRVANKLLFEDFEIADELLAGREWFFAHFTAVDAHLFWCFRRAMSFNLDVSRFGNCMAHFERMKQRNSVRKVVDYEQQVLDAFARRA